jgi:hypothetical protein
LGGFAARVIARGQHQNFITDRTWKPTPAFRYLLFIDIVPGAALLAKQNHVACPRLFSLSIHAHPRKKGVHNIH